MSLGGKASRGSVKQWGSWNHDFEEIVLTWSSLSFSMTEVDNTQVPEQLRSCEALTSSAWITNHTAPTWRLRFFCLFSKLDGGLKADSHIACRAHKLLEYVFPIWFTQCGRVWFTLAVPCPCPALTVPFFWRPRQSTSVERRPVGYLSVFGFFRLPRGVPRRYQSSSQRSIPMTLKSGLIDWLILLG
jgi:hypothetical protein